MSHPFNYGTATDDKDDAAEDARGKQVALAAAAAAEPLPWEAVAAKLAEETEAGQKKEEAHAASGDRGGDDAESFEEMTKRRVFQSTATVYKSTGAVYNDLWSSGVSHIRHWR